MTFAAQNAEPLSSVAASGGSSRAAYITPTGMETGIGGTIRIPIFAETLHLITRIREIAGGVKLEALGVLGTL
jgi:hypothetical protein